MRWVPESPQAIDKAAAELYRIGYAWEMGQDPEIPYETLGSADKEMYRKAVQSILTVFGL